MAIASSWIILGALCVLLAMVVLYFVSSNDQTGKSNDDPARSKPKLHAKPTPNHQ